MIATKRNVGGILGFWGGGGRPTLTCIQYFNVGMANKGSQNRWWTNTRWVGPRQPSTKNSLLSSSEKNCEKKLRRKLPPVRAAMTGAPGKHVIDYFFCVGWSISWPNSLRGGFFGNVSVHSSITAKRRLIHLDKYQGQSCNRRLCSKSCCNGRGGEKNKKTESTVTRWPRYGISFFLLHWQ